MFGHLRFLYRAHKYRRRDSRAEVASMLERIKAGDTVVDIGANKGGFTYWLRHAVSESGTVHAFEPQPGLARYLRERIAVAGWSNVVINQAALSDHDGEMTLALPSENSPEASLSAHALQKAADGVRVEVRSLDSYRSRNGLKTVRFIKCDCEGHELEVFRGARALLTECRPALLFECEQRHLAGRSVSDVFQYLEQLGYRGRFFSPAGLRPLDEFDLKIHQAAEGPRFWDKPGYCNNFLFEPAG